MDTLKQSIILFDLDGTLTDSEEGIIRSTQYMQEKMGQRIWSAEELHFIVGPPLMQSFTKEFGMAQEMAEKAVAIFRERHATIGLFENSVFPGVVELLQALRKKGKRLAVATSKKEDLAVRILEHFEIVGLTLVISIALAFMIAMLVMEHKRITAWITRVSSMIYAIPSLALFALLLPVTGLGMQTAVLVLVIYNQFILIQSFTDGFTSVDAGVLEAAVGMGMTKGQIFRKVRLPLALDTMIAGVHISIISTIGIATIASTVGAGGLGTILFDGMRTQNVVKIVWGTFLSVVMVLGVNGILKLIEKRLKKKLY